MKNTTALSVPAFIVALFIFSHTVALEAPGYFMVKNKKSTIIPFEFYQNLIIVPVKVNGKKLNMIMDTGIRSMVLLGDRFNHLINTDIELPVGGWGNQEPQVGRLSANNQIQIGGIQGNGISIMVLSKNYLYPHLKQKIHGIMGYQLLCRFLVKIDYIKQELIIFSPDSHPDLCEYERVALEIKDTKPYVDATIQYGKNKPIDLLLMVDLGASKEVLLNHSALPVAFRGTTKPKQNIGIGLSGKIQGFILDDVNLFLSNIFLGEYQCELADKNITQQKQNLVSQSHGLLGNAVLKKYYIIFDYAGGIMYMKHVDTKQHKTS